MEAEIIISINYKEEDIEDFDDLEDKLIERLQDVEEITIDRLQFYNKL